MPPLKCLECDKPARWHIWYKDVFLPVASANVAHNSFCDEHMFEEVRNGREGYQVVCARLVAKTPDVNSLQDSDFSYVIDGIYGKGSELYSLLVKIEAETTASTYTFTVLAGQVEEFLRVINMLREQLRKEGANDRN